ncbi:MAG: hypothetical protein H6817_10875 [Phycisphaerales bacterium]|nr:hypothetical protein [Phycisphaerales bacterium]
MDQWEVARCGGTCVATNRELVAGEEHYAVLFEDGESFRREDYCLEAWQGPPPGAFCFFKTRVPVREKKKRLLVDNDVIINFFIRLTDEDAESRLHFRFVLALILLRKRLLKYEETEQEGDKEFWIMRLVRDKEGPAHRVLNPRLNDAQIETVSRELSAILHGDMGEFDELAETDDNAGDTYAETEISDEVAEETRVDAAE